jgi:hypothetical protein
MQKSVPEKSSRTLNEWVMICSKEQYSLQIASLARSQRACGCPKAD